MSKKILLVGLVLALVMAFAGTASAQDPAEKVEVLPGSGWWTSFTLQAVNGDANFTVVAKDANSDSEYNAAGCSVSDGASVIYNPNQTPNFGSGSRIGFSSTCGADAQDAVPSGFEGGVTVSSDAELVAVVSVGNNPAGSGGVSGGTASAFYTGIDGTNAVNEVSFPVAKNNYFNQTTTFYIQAVTDASVTLTYASGQTDGPHALTAGETRVFSPADASVPDSTLTAATASAASGEQIVGTVVEHHNSESPATFALSTRGFLPSEASDTVYLPSIKNEFFGGVTGAAVQAVGGDVTVDISVSVTNSASGVTCTGGTVTGVSITNGESALIGGGQDFNLPSGFPNGCFGSAIVTKTSGAGQIVATVNETSNAGKAVYSGFPASAASQTVAVPLAKETFFGGATAIVVQAVGDSGQSTTISASYVNSGTCASGCSVTPDNGGAGSASTAGGSAVNFRRLNEFSSQYTGSLPADSTNNAVTISSTALPVVAIAQETGSNLDVKNYEGSPLSTN